MLDFVKQFYVIMMRLLSLLRGSKNHIESLAFRAYASQLTLGVLLALFPAVLVTFTMLGFWFDAEQVVIQAFLVLETVVPATVLELVQSTIYEVLDNQSVGVFSIGFVILIYTVESLIRQVMHILNQIYGVQEKRPIVRRLLLSLLLLLGGVVLLIAIVQLLFVTEGVVELIHSLFGFQILSFEFLFWRWPLVIFVVFGFVYLTYVFIPNLRKHCWRYHLPGAVFFTLGWLVMSLLFNLYVSSFADYNKTYGVLGTIILTLFYLQLNSYLYILGGVLNSRFVTNCEEKPFRQLLRKIFRR